MPTRAGGVECANYRGRYAQADSWGLRVFRRVVFGAAPAGARARGRRRGARRGRLVAIPFDHMQLVAMMCCSVTSNHHQRSTPACKRRHQAGDSSTTTTTEE